MRRFRTTIVLALATLLSLSICSAQQAATTAVPNFIRYSGTLKDAGGAALSSSTVLGVTFSIYKQQDGGASVWMETQNVTLDSNGQYNVILGSTNATGLPDDLFSQQEQRWLGVQVQGQAEQARVMLVSVPYAFKAHEAETLGGLPASAFVKAAASEESSDTATGTSVNALNAAARTSNAKGNAASRKTPLPCSTGGLGGGGTGNFIAIWQNDGTGCNLANSIMSQVGVTRIDDGGNFNLASTTSAYQIGTDNVLSIGPPLSGNLFLGVDTGTGGGNNTFSGFRAGHNNAALGYDNTFTGAFTGFNNGEGEFNTYTGFRAGFVSGGSANTFTGALAGHFNLGSNNVFSGYEAGYSEGGSTTRLGSNNTFTGYQSGAYNIVDGNSFYGYHSGMNNTTGVQNTFVGLGAGSSNSVGHANTLLGYNAGVNSADPTGGNSYNTFVGTNTGLNSNGGANTFLGYSAGSSTNTGSGNTATGYDAGGSNTIGYNNAYYGVNADFNANGAVTTGYNNTYLGAGAGSSFSFNTFTRYNNTFVGAGAGSNNGVIMGSNNIFVGVDAGSSELDVSNNIEIGNTGPAPEEGAQFCVTGKPCSNQILIGTRGQYGDPGTQVDTYVQGIYNSVPSSQPWRLVCVDKYGKLWGSNASVGSAFCGLIVGTGGDQVMDMGDRTNKLFQLRPVTFFYKPQYDDGSHSLQYGLIADEVAKVYPEMAEYNKDGQPVTVKYQLLAPMLLNELQKQHTVVAAQQDVIKTQQGQIQTQGQQIADLQQRLSRLESLIVKR